MSVEDRIKIAREAVMSIRHDKRYWSTPKIALSRKFNNKWPITYGFYGLLDYIELGDPKKIMDSTIRNAVEKIIALRNSSRIETDGHSSP